MKALAIGVCVLATAAAGWAGSKDMQISGAVNAGYTHTQSDGEGVNGFGGGGAVLVSLSNPGVNFQLSGGGSRTSASGVDVDTWVADADVFWRDRKGAIGASVAYGSADVFGLSADVTGYGIFGEWYASRWMTLRFNGGGFSGDLKGWYGGGGGEFYLFKNAAIDVEFDYLHPTSSSLSDLKTAGLGVEYLFSESLPISLRLSYDHAWSTGVDANSFGIALRYRIGAGGALVDIDRTGPARWNAMPAMMRAW